MLETIFPVGKDGCERNEFVRTHFFVPVAVVAVAAAGKGSVLDPTMSAEGG